MRDLEGAAEDVMGVKYYPITYLVARDGRLLATFEDYLPGNEVAIEAAVIAALGSAG